MPDVLTTQEINAIRAFDPSKIQRIPRGHSAFAVKYDEATGALTYGASGASTHWRRSTQRGAVKAARKSAGAKKPKGVAAAKQAADLEARLNAVSALVEQGMHRGQIMQAMPGLTEAQLTYAFRKLGVAPGRNTDLVAERRKRVAEMVDAGTWTGPAICAKEGISRVVLAKDLKATGKKLPKPSPLNSHVTLSAEVAARQEQIRALAAQGMGRKEIADATGFAISTVERHVKDMKLQLARKSGGNTIPAVQQRLAQIAKLQAQGLTCRQIAEKIGACEKNTRRDLAKIGLKAAPAIPSKR